MEYYEIKTKNKIYKIDKSINTNEQIIELQKIINEIDKKHNTNLVDIFDDFGIEDKSLIMERIRYHKNDLQEIAYFISDLSYLDDEFYQIKSNGKIANIEYNDIEELIKHINITLKLELLGGAE